MIKKCPILMVPTKNNADFTKHTGLFTSGYTIVPPSENVTQVHVHIFDTSDLMLERGDCIVRLKSGYPDNIYNDLTDFDILLLKKEFSELASKGYTFGKVIASTDRTLNVLPIKEEFIGVYAYQHNDKYPIQSVDIVFTDLTPVGIEGKWLIRTEKNGCIHINNTHLDLGDTEVYTHSEQDYDRLVQSNTKLVDELRKAQYTIDQLRARLNRNGELLL